MPAPSLRRAEAEWLYALGDPTRLAALRALAAGEASVGVLAGLVGTPATALAYHLRVLTAAGLVTSRKDGRHVRVALVGAAVAGDRIDLAHPSGARVSVPLAAPPG